MALLRWIHLRKLVPIEDLIAERGPPARRSPKRRGPPAAAAAPARARPPRRRRRPRRPRVRSPTHPALAASAPPSPSRAPARQPLPGPAGKLQGRAARRDPQVEGRVLQHGGRAGAEDRGRRRSRDVHVFAGAARAARHVRAEPRVARGAGAAGGRPQDRGRGVQSDARPRRRRAGRRRRAADADGRTRNRRCASRRSPTPACRRCSKSFPRKSATSRRCE